MRFILIGLVQTLAAFGIASLVGSAAIALAWRFLNARVARLEPALRARVLLGARLFPTFVGLLASAGLVLPAYVLLEPRGAVEAPGLVLSVAAAFGLVLLVAGVRRFALALFDTRRVVGAWARASHEVAFPGIDCPVYRVETSEPVVALAGARHPRLFIAATVLDGCAPSHLAAMAAHEAGHWRSADNVKRLMAEAVADPLALLGQGPEILAAWTGAAEEAADDEAIAAGISPMDLAESLVGVARLSAGFGLATPAGAAAFYRAEVLERRVRRLVAGAVGARPRPSERGLAFAAILLTTAWILVVGALLRPVHQLFEGGVYGPDATSAAVIDPTRS